MKHLEYCTHVQFPADFDILNRPNFDVNIRLLQCNSHYKEIVKNCVEYIIRCAWHEKDGYKAPHGWSGANAGIPFRIIALNDGRYFINPRIVQFSEERVRVRSNCGSLTLEKPHEIWRYREIDLSYYTLDGEHKVWLGIGPTPGYTIQHEIDHCDGILLTNL